MLRRVIFGCVVSVMFGGMVFGKVLDPMEDIEGWGAYNDEGAKIELAQVKGKKDKAVQISYTLDPGGWVAMDKKDLQLDMSKLTKVSFSCMMTGKINAVEFKLGDADGSIFGKIFKGSDIGKKWNIMNLPLSEMQYLWGGDEKMDWKNVVSISFAVSKGADGEGGSGKLFIDEIEYEGTLKKGAPKKAVLPVQTPAAGVADKLAKAKGEVLDSMDSTEEWAANGSEGSKIELSAVKTKNGKAVEISYDLSGNGWVQMNKIIDMDMSDIAGLRFSYIGTGNANTLEVKLEDADGSNFGKLCPSASATKTWTTLTIPIEEMAYWWGGDNKLDRTKVKNILFAISKKDADKGGAGKVAIDQIEIIKAK